MPRSVADWTPAERTAAYRILAETPLRDWSEYTRVLIWDRLCITLRDLDFWIAARGERRPGFLLHPAQPAKKPGADRQGAIHAAAECEEWLLTLMAGPQSEPKKTYLEQAKEKWPDLTGAEFDRAWAAAAKRATPVGLARGADVAADSADSPHPGACAPNIVATMRPKTPP